MRSEGTISAMGTMPGDPDDARSPFGGLFERFGIEGPGEPFGDLPFGGDGPPFGFGDPFGGGAGGDDAAATFAEEALGDFSDDPGAPTDIGALELGTTVVTATHQGEPRDLDYVTFTVPEGTELGGLTVEAYEAGPGNLAFFGIERGAEFTTPPGTEDASTLLGGLTYAHWTVSLDVLGLVGRLEGAQGFEGPLGPGDYTLWLNQTGPANTVSLGLELTEEGAQDEPGNPFFEGGPFARGDFGDIPFGGPAGPGPWSADDLDPADLGAPMGVADDLVLA